MIGTYNARVKYGYTWTDFKAMYEPTLKFRAKDLLLKRIYKDLDIRYNDYPGYVKFLKYLGITDALPFKDDNWITHFKMMVRLYGDT